MAKSKVFWITRDEEGQKGCCVWNYAAHPFMETNGKWNWKDLNSGDFADCPPDLPHILGITLAPGQRVKARLEIGE